MLGNVKELLHNFVIALKSNSFKLNNYILLIEVKLIINQHKLIPFS